MTTTAPDRQLDPYGTWDPSQATDDPDGMPDRAIVPLVESLRARGIITLQSCAGHLEYQTDGSRVGRDGTLWVRADSVDGAHIRLFLTGEPFDRVQYAYLPDAPHWEFGWHADRAEEAMQALGGLLPAVPAEQPAPDRQPSTPGQALPPILAEFWEALGRQQAYYEQPDVPFPDPIFRIRTRPDMIFDDDFWDVFHRFPFHICHVAYYGPERSEEVCRSAGVFELRWVQLSQRPTTYTMPAEPPETVTQMWDHGGCRWERDSRPRCWRWAAPGQAAPGHWHLDHPEPLVLPWAALVSHHGPLSTAPPAGTEGDHG